MSTTLESPSLTDHQPARASSPPPPPHKSTGRALTIALAGNPNAGKTTLFNKLTGLRQKVANYPGVTVERKEGAWSLAPGAAVPARLIDLPGLYSLDAASIDEQIARDVLKGRIAGLPAPDLILVVVDATNLERNLYLAAQLLEYGRPLVIALTMIDLAERRGIEIDVERLAGALGVPVVPVVAAQRRGIDALSDAILKTVDNMGPGIGWRLSEAAEGEVRLLSAANAEAMTERHAALCDLYGEDLPADAKRREAVKLARARLSETDENWWQEPLLARYDWIERIVAQCVRPPGEQQRRATTTERIDRILTHKVFGPLVLIAVMLLVFQTIFSWAALPMDLIDKVFGTLGATLRAAMPPGLLTDLLVDGIIAGVGGVLVFLPQILLLFFFITILEDTGYMARAAFLMDRLMRGVGLHGKAFMPLLSSFACAIPGIMATRTIENPKDRFATIMIAPFMSCSARLPVYALLIAAFFSTRKVFGVVSVGALMIVAMYLLGITVAVCVAWILKHTILKAPAPPLVLELPPYRVPNLLTVTQTIWSRAWLFVRRAGTVILAISIILWALVTFPRTTSTPDNGSAAAATAAAATGMPQQSGAGQDGRTASAADQEGRGQDDETGEQIRNSFAGRAGRFIEPAIAPLGFDWKMGIGLISSFAARETLVSTFSIVYNVGPDENEGSPSLIDAVRDARRPDGTPAWTPLVAVSMMVFFVLACQCMSTVAVVRRETNSWRWPLFMVGYMLALAYIASLITFQGGRLLGFS
ncbi:MAG TPA: ferrous iron transport protein B [Pyrinomonadaceae bacterium]|jgi:ferrous iron transport protein B|nr:ferrous iron transport protein B [Pyrinomonadaceae bacterium]